MSKQMIIALALLATGAAYAEGPIDWPPEQPFAATKTRAEVRAEMFAARASGETAAVTSEDSGATYLARLEPVIRLSRAQVVAEMFAARATFVALATGVVADTMGATLAGGGGGGPPAVVRSGGD